MQYTYHIILLFLILSNVYFFRRDTSAYNRFAKLADTKERQGFYMKWTLEPFVIFGVSSLIVLLVIGKFHTLFTPPEFIVELNQIIIAEKLRASNSFLAGIIEGINYTVLPMLMIGGSLWTFFHEYSNSKKDNSLEPKIIEEENFRNLAPLIPRNFNERVWGALLSINAGFSEELFFRLLIPILVYGISQSAIAAVLVSTLWFGLAHYYQGLSGIIAMVHAIIDLNGLTLGPWLKEKFAS